MDDPIMLGLIAILVIAVGVVAIMASRKKAGAAQSNDKTKRTSSKARRAAAVEAEDDEDQEEQENLDWGVVKSANVVGDTKVSVQDVDALTEFNVYKQFGYYEKAAESLSDYLEKTKKADTSLVSELVGLWIEAKNPDAVNDVLMKYQSLLNREQMEGFIKAGLALDPNHLGLRVLAENSLGWNVKKTAEEIGEKMISQVPEVPKKQAPSFKKKTRDIAQDTAPHQPLVVGSAALKGIHNDEKGAVLAFMEPEQGVKLLKDSLSYDAATKYLNMAIRRSRKPASLLIDALTLDYRAKNINGFAQYGRQVKERMLGWGYSLGQHPVFEQLESNPNELALKEIGMQQGFLDGGSLKKARYQALVSEKVEVNKEPRTAVERILKEVDSLLMYGQLESAMELLEQSITEHPQESQLYIVLFDLYERAEEWGRLEDMLVDLRSQVQTLPEEVVLAMSQLLQRFNNGSFGH